MKFRLIALMAILALVVAACSSSDEEAAETTTVPPTTEAMAEEMTEDTIVDVAIAGEFNTLVAAVQAAGLVETLQGEGPFTVFAPTDEAFAALPEGTLESLLEDPEALAEILTYHVVSGEVLAADVVGLDAATTVQGSDISIEVVDGGVVLNGSSNVVATDVLASNGVVHVIDAVILPPAS
ncbi:MAG: fasciclin domain-containing protein [Acidimicrobiia bacterium]|nr:fasciclin domain-containing protein [Acidimicrobiia bacterium]